MKYEKAKAHTIMCGLLLPNNAYIGRMKNGKTF